MQGASMFDDEKSPSQESLDDDQYVLFDLSEADEGTLHDIPNSHKRPLDRIDSGVALDEQYSRQIFNEHVQEWWKAQSVNSRMMTAEKYFEILQTLESQNSPAPVDDSRKSDSQDKKHADAKLEERRRRYVKRFEVHNGKIYYTNDVKKARASKDSIESLPQITHLDNVYDAIKEAHEAVGHGGQHKTEIEVHKKWANVPRCLIKIFIEHYPCNFLRKKGRRIHKVHQGEDPLLPDEFNVRGLVHLLDMPQDGYFRHLFYFQDQHTKFCHMRALHTTDPTEVAAHLTQIFVVQGAPLILYITAGPIYTTQTLNEIQNIWPMCRLVQSNPLTSAANEQLLQDARNASEALNTWMKENGSSNWSAAVPFTMYQLNTTTHASSHQQHCSFRLLYNMFPRLGISSLHMVDGSLEGVSTEDQLVEVLHKAIKDRGDDEHGQASDTPPESDDIPFRRRLPPPKSLEHQPVQRSSEVQPKEFNNYQVTPGYTQIRQAVSVGSSTCLDEDAYKHLPSLNGK